ncbi:dephospho-CoA kinase [Salibacter halophilus]|uniref:Dephospho-CoA kinase n=1 Tax=Salibacter halophilus TaxID=1803916 RepID=A0A6N6M4K8_9FLAO|nr:dephospho-CoA kinase [Salibacter halophilus]KAB1064305.1 dephospho-CoA kinase [Salibacter halophilus]
MIVGVTGGIGSGKSTVCRIFQSFGIPIYDADQRAKALYVESDDVKAAVIDLLGEKAYKNDKPDRDYIAKVVFDDKSKLEKLNGIIHPAVKKDFENWYHSQNTTYVIKEAAIMIESGSYKQCDKLILVTAPKELRIKRVVERDKVSAEEVEKRMSNQMTDDEKRAFCDYEILNDGKASLIEQVRDIHPQLLSFGQKPKK